MLIFLVFSATVAASGSTAEIVATDLQFPEGTIFIGSTLYFVDYSTSDVLKLEGGKVRKVWHQNGCGANGLLASFNTLIVACFDSNTFVRVSLDGKVLETIRQDSSGTHFSSPNDLTSDGRGGAYLTTSASQGTDYGKIFHLAQNGEVTEVAADIRFANGIAVSPDGRLLYVVETHKSQVLAFDIRPDGGLTRRRTLINLANAIGGETHTAIKPDSMRVDKKGNLFVTLYDGGGYVVLSPAGKITTRVNVAGAHHTNLAISPDGTSVFITAVDDSPLGYRGRIYRIDNPVP